MIRRRFNQYERAVGYVADSWLRICAVFAVGVLFVLGMSALIVVGNVEFGATEVQNHDHYRAIVALAQIPQVFLVAIFTTGVAAICTRVARRVGYGS